AAFSPHLEKEFRQVQVTLVTGHPIKLGQPHLNDFMSRPDVKFVGTESIIEQIGFFDGDVQKIRFTSGLIMGGGRFEEVAGVVKFVAVNRIHFPTLGASPAMRVFGINRASRIKIAIPFLRAADLLDQIIQVSPYFWIWLNR